MKSVQMGSCKALNETAKIAKITRIAKFRKAVDEIYGEMQMVRESPHAIAGIAGSRNFVQIFQGHN